MTDTPVVVIIESAPPVQVEISADSPVTIDVPDVEPIPGVEILQGDTTLVEVQVPGMPGPEGPPGTSARAVVDTFTAAEILSGHNAVIAVGASSVAKASKDDPTHNGKVIGITLNAALLDADVDVASAGQIIEPSFTFAIGPVYLGANGALTQVVPTSGFLQQLATAVEATRIIVNIQTPINLA